MLGTINIKKKNNKSRPEKTYFWVCNVYLKQLLSFGFPLESFASHKFTKL